MQQSRSKKVLFLAACYFPFGEASSIRTVNLCKLMSTLGYSVHVIADFGKQGQSFQQFSYECICPEKSKINLFLAGTRCLKRVVSYLDKNDIGIIVTHARNDRLERLKKICKDRNIKLIVENCEWYDSSSYRFGKIDYRFIRNERMLRKGFKGVDGFISISTLLHKHNSKFGKSSIIPTIIDFDDYQKPNTKQILTDRIHLIYAGNPGNGKELFKPIFKAFENNLVSENFILEICGPDKKRIKKLVSDDALFEKHLNSVVFRGKIEQGKLSNLIKEAHFLIFIRPKRKSSDAGFPTKMAEAMAVGTPVITNNTGDIALYLKNGLNGYLLRDETPESLVSVLMEILQAKNSYVEMRNNSYITAKESFDLTLFKEKIGCLLDGNSN